MGTIIGWGLLMFFKAVLYLVPDSGFPLISNIYAFYDLDWSSFRFCILLKGAVPEK